MSSGCIRMLNQDVIDLHRRVPTGTKVVVLGSKDGAREARRAAPETTGSLAEGRAARTAPGDGLDHGQLGSLSARASEAMEPPIDEGDPDDDRP